LELIDISLSKNKRLYLKSEESEGWGSYFKRTIMPTAISIGITAALYVINTS